MGFRKKDNIYIITHMTGNRDNFLGISFAENIEGNPEIEQNPEVIEIQNSRAKKYNKPIPKDELLKQVLNGLEVANQYLGTNYKLSHIYYDEYSDGPIFKYPGLARELIFRYHSGDKFNEA